MIQISSTNRSNTWANLLEDPLPGRTGKPRNLGITMLIDTGLGLSFTRDLIEIATAHIDYVKLGFGSSRVYPEPVLREKVRQWNNAGVIVYPGGTLLETAVLNGAWERFLESCGELGFRAVEVSDGTIQLDRDLRHQIIVRSKDMGFTVLSEVGKKKADEKIPLQQQLKMILEDLDAGSKFVILEGRESGRNVGLYDADGRLCYSDLEELVLHLGPSDIKKIIWEAPLKTQQQELIRVFGPNVNLGNVSPYDVTALESLRRGLRSDTLQMSKLLSKESQVRNQPTIQV